MMRSGSSRSFTAAPSSPRASQAPGSVSRSPAGSRRRMVATSATRHGQAVAVSSRSRCRSPAPRTRWQVSKPQVLVVDDDRQICRALLVGLTKQGYDVQLATSGEEALDLAVEAPPGLILLDLGLPGMSGVDVCRELRQWSRVPIIVLSAQGEDRTKVAALDSGADDYLTKPFGLEELFAHMRAVLRRTKDEAASPVLLNGALRLDHAAHAVTLDGQPVSLTRTQYELLRYLMAHAGKLVTYRALIAAVWGPNYEGDDTRNLRVFIAQLRRKIESDPTAPSYILTMSGVGYRFRPEP